MWRLDSFTFAFNTVLQVLKNRDIINPLEAREQSKKATRDFYEITCPKYWIEIEYKFWDDTISDYPELVDSIRDYIEIWEDIHNWPLMYIWNHQAFWLEALWAYDYFPLDWKIILKDDLLKPPFFWKWIKSIEPIVHYRKKSWSEEYRKSQIKNNILNNKAVLIYPEWTRSKDWKVRNFKTSLYETAYNTIKDLGDDVSKKVALITSNTYWVLPNTLEKALSFRWKLNQWKIIYTIDIIDIENYETIKKFNADIRKIILNNLSS